jgi:hypothetical protein
MSTIKITIPLRITIVLFRIAHPPKNCLIVL